MTDETIDAAPTAHPPLEPEALEPEALASASPEPEALVSASPEPEAMEAEPVEAASPGAERARLTMLHIGTMKSGTSFLQDVLASNRGALKEEGVRYLGRGTRAVWDVLSLRPETAKTAGAWRRLVDRAAHAPEPVRLLSMEILSIAYDPGARAIVESLAPDRVEVVITARDMARVIPSAWQNAVKHGGLVSFPDFVTAVTKDDSDRTHDRFWRQHDVAVIARRWASIVGADRVHLVTVPRSGAPTDLLWERFCTVLDVDPAAYELPRGQSSNFSLSFSDAELLRQLNHRVAEEMTREDYNRYIRTFLANEVMRPPEKGGPVDAPRLDAAGHAWAVRRGERLAAELAELGINVVGDLSELVPTTADPGSSSDPMAPRVVYPESAVRVIAVLLQKLIEVDPASTAEPVVDEVAAQRRRARATKRQVRRAAR